MNAQSRRSIDAQSSMHRAHVKLTRYIRRLVRDPVEAEDLAQEAYVRALERARNEAAVLEAPYLFVIGRNLAIDSLRCRARRARIFRSSPADSDVDIDSCFAGEPDSSECSYSADQTFDRVMHSLERLPPKCQSVFLMNKIQEKTYPEIARDMNLSVSMIEKYVSRALAHVRAAVPNVHYQVVPGRTGVRRRLRSLSALVSHASAAAVASRENAAVP